MSHTRKQRMGIIGAKGNEADLRVMEKAFHSFRTAMTGKIAGLRSEARSQGDLAAVTHYDELLRGLVDAEEDHTKLDNAHIFKALKYLPAMPDHTPPEGDFQSKTSPVFFRRDDLASPEALETLKLNADNGVPVILGTLNGVAGGLKAVGSGTPSDHAVAVQGPATAVLDGKSVEGILVYDTY